MKTAIDLLEKAMAEIRSESATSFITNLKLGKTASYINEALAELKKPPRWEMPEQYEARTGKAWPDDWAVYYRYVSASGKLDTWRTSYYENIASSNRDFRSHNAGHHQIVCATEAGPPPNDWRPQ